MVRIKSLIMILLSTIALLISTSCFAVAVPKEVTKPAVFNATQQQAIEKIIREYLINNPEVLLEASIKLREKMKSQQQQSSMKAIEKNKQALFNDPNSPFAGNPNGNKILVEFFDYQCPHCKTMSNAIQNLLNKNKDLKVIFKDWPIFGGGSALAAKAAIAANQQGKYFSLHDALLRADNPITEEKIMQLAKDRGINIETLKKDMESPKTDAIIKANFELAKKLGLQGTPAFVLTNKRENIYKFIPGETTESNLQTLLDQLKQD